MSASWRTFFVSMAVALAAITVSREGGHRTVPATEYPSGAIGWGLGDIILGA